MLKLFSLTLCVICVSGFSRYRKRIPNGNRVPDPCGGEGDIWSHVGHIENSRKGDINQFGKDFSDADHTWTTVLCELDSDGDGVTNGEELGDPRCEWEKRSKPAGPATGHPGICEPVSSDKCAGSSFVC
ncbi:hypothetical protein ScPMuIL_000234 [Solemya velum]